MTPDERALAIAARIADGSAIDWPEPSSSSGVPDRETLIQLKAIEALAALHRAPDGSMGDETQPAGSRWGPLALISKIGEGLFGEVYRAWDPRLQRQVALKLLRASPGTPDASSTHAIEEARLLARVRHPNVLTVYGAEVIDGQIGIWTEFVEGRTLETIIKERGPLPAGEVVAIGIDLCRALAAVHGAGLLHRDIKAQNVMRETSGRIVLMDFGTSHDLELVPARGGDLSGTPLYLAPEIFAGEAPSIASDIYALAVLLYYALSGQHPVAGRTLDDVRRSHESGKDVVPLSRKRPDLPEELARVVEHGIAPNPAGRFETADAFEAALVAVQARTAPAVASATTPKRLQVKQAIGVAVIVVLVAIAAVLTWPRSREDGSRTVGIERLTATGDVALGAISPSGRLLAYARTGPEGQSIWLHRITGSSPGQGDTQLSREYGRLIDSLAVAPDDSAVFVVAKEELIHNLWRIDVASGDRFRIATDLWSGAGVSPDGRYIAFVRRSSDESASRLVVANANGTGERVLSSAALDPLTIPVTNRGINQPAWSPDGRAIAVVRRAEGQLAIVPVSGGSPEIIRGGPAFNSGVSWLDNRRLLISGAQARLATSELWTVDISTHRAEPVVEDVDDFKNTSVTYTGRFATAMRQDTRIGIWVGGANAESLANVFPESAGVQNVVSVDGAGRIAYGRHTPNGDSLWLVSSPDAKPEQLAAFGESPTFTPDGRAVLFIERVDKARWGLYRVDLDSRQVVEIFHGLCFSPSISPNSVTAYVTSNHSGIQDVWAVPVNGGDASELTNALSFRTPLVSADGKTLIFGNPDDGVVTCGLPDCLNPRPVDLPFLTQTPGAEWHLAPDDSVGFVLRNAPTNLWLQRLDGGPPKQLTRFSDRAIKGFAWSADGTRLAIARATVTSDIVLIKGLVR